MVAVSTKRLNDKHHAELIERRGLPADWVHANCWSVPAKEATDLLGYEAKSDGIMLQGDGWQIQFKPDKPWKGEADKKAPKYRSPKDAYDAILPSHPEDKQYWRDLEALKKLCWHENGVPYLLITEGLFKAITGCANGLPTIALLGVEMGLTSSKDDPQGKRYLVQGLEKFARAGFGFIIAFDADCATKPAVIQAERTLTFRLKKFGAPVRSITGGWNEQDGKGMDDYIEATGIEEFRAILLKAEERQWDEEEGTEKKPPTPKALADQLLEKFKEHWRYHLQQQCWRIWNGRFWEQRADEVILKLLKTQVTAMGIDYPREAYIEDVLKSLKLLLLIEEWETFDRGRYIAGANGILDIEKQHVEPHQPGFGFTSVLPHEVRAFSTAGSTGEILQQLETTCPEVNHFFTQSMLGDSTKVLKLLAVINGILRFRLSRLETFIHLIGEPGTGKGTFFRLIKAIVGIENYRGASLSKLDDGSTMARIINAQVAAFPDERKQVGIEWLLKLTGEDDIDYREVYSKAAGSPFHGSVIVASNNPVFAGDTTGLDRRICLIPFKNVVSVRDPNLEAKLKAEVSELISVALSMPDSLVDDLICGRGIGKLSDTKWHEWQMKIQSDKVATFIDEQVIFEKGFRQGATQIFEAYLDWAKEANHSAPGSRTFFGSRFKQHLKWLGLDGETSKSNGRTVYHGFRLRDSQLDGDTPLIQDSLLPPNSPSGTVELSLRDSSGTVSNPDTERDRDSRDSYSPKVLGNEIHSSSSSQEQPTPEKFEPKTIPTIPIQDSKPVPGTQRTIPSDSLGVPQGELHGWEDYHAIRPYPNPKSDNVRASQKRSLKIREAYQAARTKEELAALRRDNGGEFSRDELTWVSNWLKKWFRAEYEHVQSTAKISQPSLLE